MKACMTALENYFKLQRNVFLGTVCLFGFSYVQSKRESVGSYVNTLQKRVSSCEKTLSRFWTPS